MRKEKRGELKRGKRKGVSPVVATTLLIAMVFVIGLIVFLWLRSFQHEAILKFGNTNIELVCKDVQFDASYSGSSIFLQNLGNVPIYSFELKLEGPGSQATEDITNLTSDWPAAGLNIGGTFTGPVDVSGAQKMTVIPVLRGTTSQGKRSHICDKQYGLAVTL